MSAMAGGFSEAKEPDEEIEALLTEAFKASLAEAGAAGALTIKSYTVQVVAGTNYLLQLEDSADGNILLSIDFQRQLCNWVHLSQCTQSTQRSSQACYATVSVIEPAYILSVVK